MGTWCLLASRVTWWLLWALGTSCKGGQAVLQTRLRKVPLLLSLQQDAVNQFSGLVLWYEVNEEKNRTIFFFFLIKIIFRNNVLPEVEEEVTWCSTGEKTSQTSPEDRPDS